MWTACGGRVRFRKKRTRPGGAVRRRRPSGAGRRGRSANTSATTFRRALLADQHERFGESSTSQPRPQAALAMVAVGDPEIRAACWRPQRTRRCSVQERPGFRLAAIGLRIVAPGQCIWQHSGGADPGSIMDKEALNMGNPPLIITKSSSARPADHSLKNPATAHPAGMPAKSAGSPGGSFGFPLPPPARAPKNPAGLPGGSLFPLPPPARAPQSAGAGGSFGFPLPPPARAPPKNPAGSPGGSFTQNPAGPPAAPASHYSATLSHRSRYALIAFDDRFPNDPM